MKISKNISKKEPLWLSWKKFHDSTHDAFESLISFHKYWNEMRRNSVVAQEVTNDRLLKQNKLKVVQNVLIRPEK